MLSRLLFVIRFIDRYKGFFFWWHFHEEFLQNKPVNRNFFFNCTQLWVCLFVCVLMANEPFSEFVFPFTNPCLDFPPKNRTLSLPSDSFIANKLNFNTVKREFMMIAGSHQLTDLDLPTLYVGGCQLRLLVESHDKVWKKVSFGIGFIRRVRLFVDFNTVYTLHKSLVQCHFDYCGPFWDTIR